jgi:hypothetical protein
VARRSPQRATPERWTSALHNSKEADEPGNDLHLSTAGPLMGSNIPWLKLRSAGWLKIRSAPTRQDGQTAYVPPPEPATATATTQARAFQRGDTVTFEDRDGRSITGVAVRINQRTATIGTGDGGSWRVPFHMLRHVLDI